MTDVSHVHNIISFGKSRAWDRQSSFYGRKEVHDVVFILCSRIYAFCKIFRRLFYLVFDNIFLVFLINAFNIENIRLSQALSRVFVMIVVVWLRMVMIVYVVDE